MAGWCTEGRITSKEFEIKKNPRFCDFDEYNLEVPTVILENYCSSSTQGWGDFHTDDIIVKRSNEIIKIENKITYKCWIEFNGKEMFVDEYDVPNNLTVLGKSAFNTFKITVYNLVNKTKCNYKVICEKEDVPYNERDIEKYMSKEFNEAPKLTTIIEDEV